MRRAIFLSLLLFTSTAHAAHPIKIDKTPAQITTFDHLTLSGEWIIPAETNPPQAAVLILQGSGNVDLDGDVSSPLTGTGYKGAPAKLSLQIAEYLAKIGIPSLRYSKRGVESPTELPHQTMPYLIQDASAAFQLLKNKFPQSKLMMIGFSEGALIATILASQNSHPNLSSLFLLGLPTRSIDDLLSYQFFEWPTELLRTRLDENLDDTLSATELAAHPTLQLPLLGPGFTGLDWIALDTNHDGALSFTNEIKPAYTQLHKAIMQLVLTPEWFGWYSSMRDLTPFPELAKKITLPVFMYSGELDAQVRTHSTFEDRSFFSGPVNFEKFSGLGHCFSPMDGAIGGVKTSGPFSQNLMKSLERDLRKQISPSKN